MAGMALKDLLKNLAVRCAQSNRAGVHRHAETDNETT
jgi:hypothetical protein